HYELLLNHDGHIKGLALVNGNIAVNAPGGFLNLAHDVTMTDGHAVAADTVRVQVRARAFDVFANTLLAGRDSTIAGTVTSILPPIFDSEPLVVPDPFDPANFPPNFPIPCGGPDRAHRQWRDIHGPIVRSAGEAANRRHRGRHGPPGRRRTADRHRH